MSRLGTVVQIQLPRELLELVDGLRAEARRGSRSGLWQYHSRSGLLREAIRSGLPAVRKEIGRL